MSASRTRTSSMPKVQCLFAGPQNSAFPGSESLPHVLLVVDGFPKTLGGGERILLRLAALLPRDGFRVSILTFSIHPESSFRPSDAPCPLFLLPLRRTYDLRAARAALSFRKFLREQKIQIVQTFFESSDLWAGALTRLLSPAKLVWSRRDMGILRGRKHTVAYRLFRRLPHAVFAVSEEVRRHVIDVDGIAPERVLTVHNGLDLDGLERDSPFESLSNLPRPAGPTILTIGNIRRVKGHDVLAKAAARVVERFPQATFEIAGEVLEPEFFAELQAIIHTLGLDDRFRFLGGVRELRVPLQRADLFVLPSRSEGFSNALIEAMAWARPAVATEVGGNAEAVETGVTGLIVRPGDSEALADAMLRLLSSPDDARRMGEAGRRKVFAEFTAEAMMRKIVGSYHELLKP